MESDSTRFGSVRSVSRGIEMVSRARHDTGNPSHGFLLGARGYCIIATVEMRSWQYMSLAEEDLEWMIRTSEYLEEHDSVVITYASCRDSRRIICTQCEVMISSR